MSRHGDVAELGRLATHVAVTAGRLIVDERPEVVSAAATKSSPTDVVTEMDTRAEELIRRLLLDARPDDAVLGEEGDDHRGTSGITWVVDPIDGTVNYLYGIPAYAVSVAAAVGDPTTPGAWHVLAGAVADPAHRRVYEATLGGGARVRDFTMAAAEGRHGGEVGPATAVHVGDVCDLSGALVGTGFGYTAERRSQQAHVLLDLLPAVRDIRRIGSAALDLCAVACGRLDGFYENGLNPWDMAAGWLLVTEAGGVVTGPGGRAPSAVLTLAANPVLQPQLLALVDR
jgi:myo-inositol-1(or 4)-monophosphatase